MTKFKIFMAIIFTAILLSPIIIYLCQFGFGLWDDHSRWAELGSFFSGIYSPIIAIFALIILAGQSISQNKMNKLHHDNTFLSRKKEELKYYVDKLESYLIEKSENGLTIKAQLINSFHSLDRPQLESYKNDSSELVNNHYPKILNIWIAIYPILKSMQSNNELTYKDTYTGAVLLIQTILSPQACVTLDKMLYCNYDKIFPDEHSPIKLLFWNDKQSTMYNSISKHH